ncbi:MAG TPA: MtrB/PioB family decaheme-associated outer membrane protein [Gammaproteobacteria bacterium]
MASGSPAQQQIRIPWLLGTALVGLALGRPLPAQGPDTSSWTCSRCPFPSGYETAYSAGATHVSEDAAHFGDATGYDDEGGYLNLDADGTYLGEGGQRLDWRIEDLGLDSRVLRLDGGQPGTYDYYAGFSQLPRREFDTTRSIFNESGPDTLVLPDNWVRAGLTSGFTALAGSLSERDIESDRTTLEVGGLYIPADRFDVFADFRRTERDGLDVLGGAYFTNASLLPRPFDYRTDEVDAGVRYGGDRATMKLAYYGSYFRGRDRVLRWENPFTAVAGGEFGALAQPPDSSFQQLLLSGSYRVDGYDTVVSYSAATGIMEQDDPFPAYTTNPNLTAAPLPRASLDGRVDTTNLGFTVTSRPGARTRVKLAYRHDERDNGTPVELWNHVIVDSFNSSELLANVPYSYKRRRLSLRGDLDVADGIRVTAGYDSRKLDRDFQEVAEQDEDSTWGQVSWNPSPYVSVRAKAGTARRDVDRYDTGLATSLGQNPLLRKYHLAYRYREFGELWFAASWPELPISISGTVRLADDSYTRSRLGLVASDDVRVAADFSWAMSESSSLYLSAALDEIDSEQAGSEQFLEPDWRATHADEFLTYGGGYRVEGLRERFDLEIDYTRGAGQSRIDLTSASAGGGPFPELQSTLDSLRVRLRYRVSERLEGHLDFRYERFNADDWTLQSVEPATIPNVLSLGADPYDYDVVRIGVGVRYSFSGDGDDG